ncbi:MAG TPA: hypothetical protein VNH40_12325 [Gaiellaceae bacterium]|nr:hypothetical protein [Gaiellaceae bacterium]
MFSPPGRHLERGWPGRIDGDRVIQLAAQTLQAFFTGGGHAREHAEFRLADVTLLAPVLHPPSVRIFDGKDFRFANPAAIVGPGDAVLLPDGADEIVPVLRRAAIVGAEEAVGAYTLLVEWVAPELSGAKRRDFALTLGPVALTPDELPELRLEPLLAEAARNTRLVPGDLVAAPGQELPAVPAGDWFETVIEPFGALGARVERRP